MRNVSFPGVFYGAVCIGMAGVASMMGNILQVRLFIINVSTVLYIDLYIEL